MVVLAKLSTAEPDGTVGCYNRDIVDSSPVCSEDYEEGGTALPCVSSVVASLTTTNANVNRAVLVLTR